MKIAIIACESFKREMEHLVLDDPDIVHKEFLEFGLHEYPQELKAKVIEKVNQLEGQVDAVLLGYGTCQSLKDVHMQMRVPTIMFEEDDCVGVFLTSPEYEKERKKCTGTWFATPYFSEMGTEWFKADMRKKMGPSADEIDTKYVLKLLFDGYSRCLYVHTGVGDREYFEAHAKMFADELGLRTESRDGTMSRLEDAIKRTKELARENQRSSTF
jgi:hypothetical protein